MNYQWLLFDADGTLFDFDTAETKALATAFREFGYPYDTQTGEIYRRINGEVWRALEQGELTPDALRTIRFERLFTAVNVPGDPIPFSAVYLRHLGQCGDLIAGADALLAQLNGRFRLALITNGLSDVQRPRLAASGLATYFETVTISDEVGAAKPDGRIFDVAFTQMGQPAKSDVLIIGDSLTSDMAGGANYGIDTCWYNPNGKTAESTLSPTYEIKHLSELTNILS